MNFDKLYEILRKTTGQLRKGEVYEGSPQMVAYAKAGDFTAPAPGGVLEIYAMPSEKDPGFDGLEKVDLHFVTIAVDKGEAERQRENLISILNDWPDPERLAGGPSYIEVGGIIGDQGAAFELFALGKVLGLWSIITPETFGATGAQARELAGAGYIMCSGYRPASGMEAATAGETGTGSTEGDSPTGEAGDAQPSAQTSLSHTPSRPTQ